MKDFQPTSTLMTNVVRNIIQGYGDGGEIRALAQEPVQNAKDAKNQTSSQVEVTYEVHERTLNGQTYHLLTVTDKGTHGLRGEIYAPNAPELQGSALPETENWAAFEGQGFTKSSGSALGSRGQGKSAFLYHSDIPIIDDRDRMAMLYDTHLEDGTYRLGIRYANPLDCVRFPPWLNDSARSLVQSKVQIDEDLHVCLELEPLSHSGTRVIIPYLSDQVLDSIETGEFQRWLKCCWWRAIQTGTLKINVKTPNSKQTTIGVPECWKSYSSKNVNQIETTSRSEELSEWRNIALSSDPKLKIKRIVLKFEPGLSNDDIEDASPQFMGVQLLRGQQWISTMSSKADFSDQVPENKRNGFRGFVEFDKGLEKRLREECESPQHNGFNGRKAIVKEVRQIVTKNVETFAEKMGWKTPDTPISTPEEEKESFEEFISFFSPPSGSQTTAKARWDCDLKVEYPNELSRRVDWGESIQDVRCVVTSRGVNPQFSLLFVELWLEGAQVGKNGRKILSKAVDSWSQKGAFIEFGSFQIIQGNESAKKLQIPEPGKHHLVAKLYSSKDLLATDRKVLYVHADPPQPVKQDLSVVIQTTNICDPRKKRIDWGEQLHVEIYGINREPQEQNLLLDVSISDPSIASDTRVRLPACPLGETKVQSSILHRSFLLQEPRIADVSRHDDRKLYLHAGRHRVRVDLKKADSTLVAHNTKSIYVETDPNPPSVGLPFTISRVEDSPFPIWQLDNEKKELKYSRNNPIYSMLSLASKSGKPTVMSFIQQITGEGFIEYMLSLGEENPDELEAWLERDIPVQTDTDLWDRMNNHIEYARTLRAMKDADFALYGSNIRDAVSLMIAIHEPSG